MAVTTDNKVSIRLMSGGHSFSERAATSEALMSATTPMVEVITSKVTLLPEEMSSAATPKEHLQAAGITLNSEEVAIMSTPHNGMVAAMAIEQSSYRSITELKKEVRFTTPLLAENESYEVVITLHGSVLYVVIANPALRLAEAIEVDNDADILYYIESIARVYNIYDMRARAKGDTSRLQKLLKHQFKYLVCE